MDTLQARASLCGPHRGRRGSGPAPAPPAGCPAHCKRRPGRPGCLSWLSRLSGWRSPQENQTLEQRTGWDVHKRTPILASHGERQIGQLRARAHSAVCGTALPLTCLRIKLLQPLPPGVELSIQGILQTQASPANPSGP